MVARISQPLFKPFHRLRLAFLGKTDGHYAGITLTSDAPPLLYNTQFFSNPKDLQKLIHDLNAFQPNIISGYAGTIYQLAMAQLDGQLKIQPGRLQSSGELLTENMRRVIEQAFGQEVIDLYACSESIVLGLQKSGEEPFLLFNDWHHIEVVDDKNNLVPEGTQGALIITPLYRTLQPLIRYRLSDTLALKTTDQAFITLQRFTGRVEESLVYASPSGVAHTLHSSELIEFFVPGLRQFQFEQTTPQTLLLRISVHDGYGDIQQRAEKKLQEILARVDMDQVVRATVEVVDTIGLNPKTGKFKLIIPYSASITIKK